MKRPSVMGWVLTLVNVAAAVVVVWSTGYVAGLLDGNESAVTVLQTAPVVGSPGREGAPQATRVVPNPEVGQGHHPSFDCASMMEALESRPEGAVSIGELADKRDDLAGQPVTVKGRVMQAFPAIMGVNWFHVCDEPNGRVLVASARDWVHPGHDVVLRGVLSLDRNIAGAYRFPLFIEEAQLEGAGVLGGALPTAAEGLDL